MIQFSPGGPRPEAGCRVVKCPEESPQPKNEPATLDLVKPSTSLRCIREPTRSRPSGGQREPLRPVHD